MKEAMKVTKLQTVRKIRQSSWLAKFHLQNADGRSKAK